MNRSILSSMYSNQPLASVTQIVFKLLFREIAKLPIYNALRSFSTFAIANIGIIRSVFMLYSIKKYVLGYINLTTLTNTVNTVSPVVGVMFDVLLRRDIQSIRLNSFTTKISIRKLINFIIFNSFLLVVKNLVKVIIKIAIFIVMTTLSIFWVANLNHTKYLLNIAFEIKDFIKDLFQIDIPTPTNLSKTKSWFNVFIDFIYGSNKPIEKPPHVVKISKFEGTEVHFNYRDKGTDIILDNTLINNFNDTSYINQITTTEVIVTKIDSINFLIHLFNELNLFV
uniref:hypothetical protein n=1 Tax=Porodaedalea chrysoloma TaxID=74615 RepID=UPI0023AA8C80|nr:hypothetical protein P1S03_mgp28 [Porodaedalea chrysoloma]WCF76778.1 hypothetical protein [Porodaedalea chrysoloma]